MFELEYPRLDRLESALIDLRLGDGRYNLFMPYAAAMKALKSIVDRLEGAESVAWKVDAEMVHDCILSMRQMWSPTASHGSVALEESPEHEPDNAKLEMAVLHAEAMLRALWSHNRAAALGHGRAALEAMSRS